MSNKSYRISTSAGGSDKHIKIKMEQDIDSIEILSLNIKQKDIYSSFNANFGVLVGRVIANEGIGIPNAKISIFIPVSEEDKLNPDIMAIYPYETPRDKNLDGVRYNLLPRVSVNNPFLVAGEYGPNVPIGTFPTKEEIGVNETYVQVYKKYYKYTTVTNPHGDYMIFGAPVGVQTVHMSVDITDIGKYSMTVGSMINNLGYSENLFINKTKIKFSHDLEILPNVELQDVSVSIIPFWGDIENYEIGITRQDFKVRGTIINTFTIFGSGFTDRFRGTWGQNDITNFDHEHEMWRQNNPADINLSISNFRIGLTKIDVYSIKNTISDADIQSGNFSTKHDVYLLDPATYTQYIEDGQFILTIPCNRNRAIENEDGSIIEIDPSDTRGVFTNFAGMFVLDYGQNDLPRPQYEDISGGLMDGHTFYGQRWRFKIPQTSDGATERIGSNDNVATEKWRKQHYTFQGGKMYSVAKYHPLNYRDDDSNTYTDRLDVDPFWNVGIILTDDIYASENSVVQFPTNGVNNNNANVFGAEYLNFSLYFPQHTYFRLDENIDDRVHGNNNTNAENYHRFYYVTEYNNQLLLANTSGTTRMLRNDFHKTYIIEVPKEDIVALLNDTNKGFAVVPTVSNAYDTFANTNNGTVTTLVGSDYKGKTSTKFFFEN